MDSQLSIAWINNQCSHGRYSDNSGEPVQGSQKIRINTTSTVYYLFTCIYTNHCLPCRCNWKI